MDVQQVVVAGMERLKQFSGSTPLPESQYVILYSGSTKKIC